MAHSFVRVIGTLLTGSVLTTTSTPPRATMLTPLPMSLPVAESVWALPSPAHMHLSAGPPSASEDSTCSTMKQRLPPPFAAPTQTQPSGRRRTPLRNGVPGVNLPLRLAAPLDS